MKITAVTFEETALAWAVVRAGDVDNLRDATRNVIALAPTREAARAYLEEARRGHYVHRAGENHAYSWRVRRSRVGDTARQSVAIKAEVVIPGGLEVSGVPEMTLLRVG